jgi:HPr kinase/phosphorylase
VLLLGPSGVGKSECALELVTRGHRLVADDVVMLERDAEDRVWGSSPERIRHHLEIRGLGIVFVPDLYGSRSVCERSAIDLVCRLERWREGADYERVGIERDTEEVAGVKLPRVTLPARAGASMATIVEVAAREHLRRSQGRNAALSLDARLRREMGGS